MLRKRNHSTVTGNPIYRNRRTASAWWSCFLLVLSILRILPNVHPCVIPLSVQSSFPIPCLLWHGLSLYSHCICHDEPACSQLLTESPIFDVKLARLTRYPRILNPRVQEYPTDHEGGWESLCLPCNDSFNHLKYHFNNWLFIWKMLHIVPLILAKVNLFATFTGRWWAAGRRRFCQRGPGVWRGCEQMNKKNVFQVQRHH